MVSIYFKKGETELLKVLLNIHIQCVGIHIKFVLIIVI
jgi:hypothetical protein